MPKPNRKKKTRSINSCCRTGKREKHCRRKTDKKVFSLPRRFSRKQCYKYTRKGIKGFSVRSSCAPYKGCLSH